MSTFTSSCASNPISEREKLLQDAKNVVCGERQNQYGDIEDSFNTIANLWRAYLSTDIASDDVANMMILLKIARNKGGVHRDNWVDIAGYAACGSEIDANLLH
ncbi:DUF6378 domain-containing protein [Atopobium fossor]|uniref:DUF6378 domain-containing protein n=1 Tax=Atopobium fossor TaxID=39487 RepID=UPI000688EDAA|nr:DUF6378 domain-containing protein [Atopobium fossor]